MAVVVGREPERSQCRSCRDRASGSHRDPPRAGESLAHEEMRASPVFITILGRLSVEHSLTQAHYLHLMRACSACDHPERAAIDTALLQGLSLRTVAGRYGISSTALYRHRSRHVDTPTVGDILAPAGEGDGWREWDGTDWQRIATPRRERLVEIQGRPITSGWRIGWIFAGPRSEPFLRKVYRRRRREKAPTASPYARR